MGVVVVLGRVGGGVVGIYGFSEDREFVFSKLIEFFFIYREFELEFYSYLYRYSGFRYFFYWILGIREE